AAPPGGARRARGAPAPRAPPPPAALHTDGDGRVGEAEVVPAFARWFTVPE
ncbi:EF-hand domain-containing protein, partial [Streptomyces sp. NPDC059409]